MLRVPSVPVTFRYMLIPLCLALPMRAEHTTRNEFPFRTFHVPGSKLTTPQSINNLSEVTGFSVDQSGHQSGFFRSRSGKIVSFDPPESSRTWAQDINEVGAIIGDYLDVNSIQHGYVRDPSGNITLFDPPGASGTFAVSMNAKGFIAGTALVPGHEYGFILSPGGVFTEFDAPGSVSTFAMAINRWGIVVGSYSASDQHGPHGYVRNADGEVFPSDFPGSLSTHPVAINDRGTIIGNFEDSDGRIRGFLRTADGQYQPIDAPASFATYPLSINNSGEITGYYSSNGDLATHAFVRFRRGPIAAFDGRAGGTIGTAINDFGLLVGHVYNQATTTGFIGVPPLPRHFESGAYTITDDRNFYVDGGFYLYGDPTVRLWRYVANNTNQYWMFSRVPGGYTIRNQGTGLYATETDGQMIESGAADIWVLLPFCSGYKIRNLRTGLFLVDPGSKKGSGNAG